MGCLYCGGEIQPIRRMQDPDFCSAAHRRHYHDKLRSALHRLNEPEPAPTRMAAPVQHLAPVSAPGDLTTSGQFFRHAAPRAGHSKSLNIRLAPLPGHSFITSGKLAPRAAPPGFGGNAKTHLNPITTSTAQSLHLALPEIRWNPALAQAGNAGPKPVPVGPSPLNATPVLRFKGALELGDGLPAARLSAAKLPEAARPWPAPAPAASAGTGIGLRDAGGWTPFPAAPVSGPKLVLACLGEALPAQGAAELVPRSEALAGPVWHAFREPLPPAPVAPPIPSHIPAAAAVAMPAFRVTAGERPALPAGGLAPSQLAARQPGSRIAEPEAAPIVPPGALMPTIAGMAPAAPRRMPERQEFYKLRVEARGTNSETPAGLGGEPAELAPGAALLPALPSSVKVAHCVPLAAGFAPSACRALPAGPAERIAEAAPRLLGSEPAQRAAALRPRSGEGYCSAFARYLVTAVHVAPEAVAPATAAPEAPNASPALPEFPRSMRVTSPVTKTMAAPWMAVFASRPPAVAEAPSREPSADTAPLRPKPVVAAMPVEPAPADAPCMSEAGEPAHLALFWRNAPAEPSRCDAYLEVELDFHLPAFTIAAKLEPLELPAEPKADDRATKGLLLKMPERDHARRLRQHAIAQKVMAMAACILAAVALWVNGGHVTVGRALTSGEWLRQTLADRASTESREDFRSGMTAWAGNGEGWARSWSRDPEGYMRPGQFALFKPSLAKPDYRMEMLAQAERKGLTWAVRAKDSENYYAVKLAIRQPGPRPLVSLVRYPVVGGKRGKATEVPVRVTLPTDAPYRVAVNVKGRDFAASIDGQPVDSWSDDALPTGGVAFYSDAGERARLYWMRVISNDDLLGRICAMLAGKSDKQEIGRAHV